MSSDSFKDNPNWVPRQQPRTINPFTIIIPIIVGAVLILGGLFAWNTYNHAQKQAAYTSSLHVKGLTGKAKDKEFVRYLKQNNPVSFSTSTDSSLVATGKEVCLALKSGSSKSDITENMLASYFGDATTTAQLMTASMKTYCPTQK